MKYKTILFATLFVVLNLFALMAQAESSVWKISKGDDYFYLGGTIHLLDPKDYPLPEEFMRAYRDADKLIFETDIARSKTNESQQKFFTAMAYKTEKVLKDDLNNQTYTRLEAFLADRGVPVANFQKFQPWAVTLAITVFEYQRLGMLPQYGVEEFFHKLALADGKAQGNLETLEDQIAFLETMATIEPNIMVNYTLRDLEKLPEFIAVLKTSWRSGDIESFTTNSSIVQMRDEFPALYDTLVINRNNNWMSQLTTINDNDITEFILVGTLHLNGKEGLLQQLQRQGFKVEQL